MAYTFAEGLVDEILTYLDNNLPGKLDDIDSQLADGIVLDDPVSYLMRDPADLRALTNVPSMFGKVPRTNVTGWHETSAWQNHVLWLYLVDRANDPETLSKRLYRYARAIWETLVDHQFDTVTVPTWKMGIGAQPSFDFSETLTRGSMAMADVKIELQYEKLETE